MASEDWIRLLSPRKQRAYAVMNARGLWREGYNERHINAFLEAQKTVIKKKPRGFKIEGIYHKSFFGDARHIDRLSMAKRMAERQDEISRSTKFSGIRKRRRVLGDGSILTYKGGIAGNIGKITATGPKGQRIIERPWRRFVEEYAEVMDNPEAMAQIQPALLVWDNPQTGHHWSQPHGMLITRKFGPPYYYLPRIWKKDGEEIEIFSIEEGGAWEGGGWKYELKRRVQKILMKSYISTGIEDKTYVMQIFSPCYRDSCGDYDYEWDDLVYNYHGMPASSEGMQELVAYHFAPNYQYKYWNCPTQNYQTLDGYRYSHNYQGDDWVSKTGGATTYYWREDIWQKGWSEATRVLFDGDCGRTIVEEDEIIFDAAYRSVNKINLFMVGFYFDNASVDLLTCPPKPPQFTIEHLLSLVAGENWPYEFWANYIGGGIYRSRTTSLTANVWQRNDFANQYNFGNAGHGPYKYPFDIPVGYHVRQDVDPIVLACPIAVAREWYHQGAYQFDGPGQILRASNGHITKEYAAWIPKIEMGKYYWDSFLLTNNMQDLWAKNSRGYRHYFGSAGAGIFNSEYEMFAAAIWDCRTTSQAEIKDLFAAEVFEVQINDGTYVTEGTHPGPWTGTVATWGETWGGGRTGLPMSGEPFVITGKDRHEISFIVIGAKHTPSASSNAPEMVIESGGQKAVCWRRIITPDIEVLQGSGVFQKRYAYYSFAEEKEKAGIWPPPVAIGGIRSDDPENGFPENGHFRNGVVPIKIYMRPSNWGQTAIKPGKKEETHGVDFYTVDEY